MCRDDIQKIIDSARDAQTASPQPPATAPKKRLTNIQKMKLIEEIIDREIRPQLQKDGGDIELIDIEGNVVTIAFRGMCAGCQSAAFTRQDFIQAKLREFVDPDITVVDEC
jgi:NifU-like protein